MSPQLAEKKSEVEVQARVEHDVPEPQPKRSALDESGKFWAPLQAPAIVDFCRLADLIHSKGRQPHSAEIKLYAGFIAEATFPVTVGNVAKLDQIRQAQDLARRWVLAQFRLEEFSQGDKVGLAYFLGEKVFPAAEGGRIYSDASEGAKLYSRHLLTTLSNPEKERLKRLIHARYRAVAQKGRS